MVIMDAGYKTPAEKDIENIRVVDYSVVPVHTCVNVQKAKII